MVAFIDQVQQEDIVICESVQRGLSSGFYDQGKLMTRYENGIQHFERLVFEALDPGRAARSLPMIVLDRSARRYGNGPARGLRGQPAGAGRADARAAGRVGLRQDHHPEDDQSAGRADLGADRGGRPGRPLRGPRAAPARHRLRPSRERPVPAPDRRREHRGGPTAARLARRAHRRAGVDELLQLVHLPPDGVPRADAAAAFGRPAAARRLCPRPGGGAQGDAAGRAVRRPRPGDARRAAERVPADPPATGADGRHGDPRHDRGPALGRPDRRHERGPAAAAGNAPRAADRIPATTSSPP